MKILQKTVSGFGVLSFGLSTLLLATAHAAPATAQQAANNLIKQLNTLHSLSANFSQTTTLSSPQKTTTNNRPTPQHMNQTFSGRMQVARPGKFYWETISPAKQTIITTGSTVWIYDPDLQQAVKQNLDEQISNTPALLLSGNAQQIMQAYNISQPDAKKTYYRLSPKSHDAAFERLYISFGANNAPTSMILQDSMGQTTQVKFSQVKVNPALNPNLFNFTPPKGTDIIEQ
jgi:outer membrane lipoprotein carrier protein